MALKLTRRRFGQLTIATAAMGGLGYSPSNALAADIKTPKLFIVGVEHGVIVKNDKTNIKNNIVDTNTAAAEDDTGVEDYSQIPEDDTGFKKTFLGITEDYTTIAPDTTPVSAFQGLVLRFLDVKTQKITTQIFNKPILTLGERLTGLTYLADGTLIVAITPDSASANGAEPTRLLILNKSNKIIPISGTQVHEAVDSLLLLQDGSLIGLVLNKDGSSPAKIVDVNPKTGKISFSNRIDLPVDRRFGSLAESPDGKLYTSVFRANATTELVELNLAQKTVTVVAQLQIDNAAWYHGIQSLMFSPAGELFALANLEYRLPNSLYTVNINTGVMKKITDIEAARATLVAGKFSTSTAFFQQLDYASA